MSSGKKRRTTNESSWRQVLDRSNVARWLSYVLFVVFLVMIVTTWNRLDFGTVTWIRGAVVTCAVGIAAFLVLRLNHDQVSGRTSRIVLMLGGILLQMFAIVGLCNFVKRLGLDLDYEVLLTPFMIAPMIHTALLGRRAGVFSAVFGSLCSSLLMFESVSAFEFFVISLSTGLAVVMVLRNLNKRGKLLRAGIYAGLLTLLYSYAFGVIDSNPFLHGATTDAWQDLGWKSLAAVGMGVLVSLIISGILPALEGLFGLTTEMSWIELSDLNNKLLRQMQLEAAGTFHHSLVVASLSEAAAESINANATLCRVCSYFHDIGKLKKPEYFIENQNDGVNPHDSLTPTMSALVIIAHVKDGVDIAIKNKLNKRIVDVIREHHGDSLVYYFYRKAREQKAKELAKVEKGLENEEDLPEIDQKNFRYPGPRPSTKESGIICLADMVESASRALSKPTPQKIKAMIDELVFNKIRDGQLDDCPLSMDEITIIKNSFAKTLRSMLHARIDYPKDEKPADAPETALLKVDQVAVSKTEEPVPSAAKLVGN